METCEKEEHLNSSTSNSEEKQSESFNSSELDDAMNELLSQDIQESKNVSSTTNEEDLLDMMEEHSKSGNAILKLKIHAAKKILRRSRNLKKKNYYFIKKLDNNASTSSKWLTERANDKNLLRIKTVDALNKLDEKTSQTIKKVVRSGNLTIQKLDPTQIPFISKTKFTTLNSMLNLQSNESDESSLAPESFPKAIVYPDAKKINIQSTKAAEHAKMSFNEVFAKTTEEMIKIQKTLEQRDFKVDKRSKTRELTPNTKESTETDSIDVKNESREKEPVKYLIPQNLLASQSDKVNSNSNGNDSNASTSKSFKNSTSSEENLDHTHIFIPERPQINYDLIDVLADYRVIARYLFNKLNVPPIDFDGTDDYINLYKLSRN